MKEVRLVEAEFVTAIDEVSETVVEVVELALPSILVRF